MSRIYIAGKCLNINSDECVNLKNINIIDLTIKEGQVYLSCLLVV